MIKFLSDETNEPIIKQYLKMSLKNAACDSCFLCFYSNFSLFSFKTIFFIPKTLVLVGHPSSDGITIKMPCGVDVLHQPASHPIF